MVSVIYHKMYTLRLGYKRLKREKITLAHKVFT